MNIPVNRRSGTKLLHRFRSNAISLCVFRDRVIAVTENGVYRMDKNGKRWRKIKLAGAA